jgi:hypothetical protein
MRIAILVVLGLFGAVLPARAQPASPRAPSPAFTAAYTAGTDAYRLGRYDEARAHLERARDLDPSLPGPWRYLGAIARAEGRLPDCVELTREAIRLNPQSTEIGNTRTLHDDCRQALGRPSFAGTYDPGQGALSVTSDQLGATVTVNGLSYGATPLLRALPVGPAEVVVSKAGYLPGRATTAVLPEVVTDVHLELAIDPATELAQKAPVEELTQGWLRLEVSPATARVEIDGGERPLDGKGRHELPEGTYEVRVSAPGYEPQLQRVRVARGQVRTLRVALRAEAAVARSRTLGGGAVAVGVGLAAAGMVTGILSSRAADQARDWWTIESTRPAHRDDFDSARVEPVRTRAQIEARVERARQLARVSHVSYGAAAVAIGVGAYFLVKGRPAGERPGVRLAPAPILGGGGVGAAAIGEVRW